MFVNIFCKKNIVLNISLRLNLTVLEFPDFASRFVTSSDLLRLSGSFLFILSFIRTRPNASLACTTSAARYFCFAYPLPFCSSPDAFFYFFFMHKFSLDMFFYLPLSVSTEVTSELSFSFCHCKLSFVISP